MLFYPNYVITAGDQFLGACEGSEELIKTLAAIAINIPDINNVPPEKEVEFNMRMARVAQRRSFYGDYDFPVDGKKTNIFNQIKVQSFQDFIWHKSSRAIYRLEEVLETMKDKKGANYRKLIEVRRILTTFK